MERVRAPGDDQGFYIAPARSPHRERRALKLNDTFAVLDTHGDFNAALPGSDGLYHRDTRRLSYLSLTLFGAEPLLLGFNLADDASYIRVDLTNPDIYRGGEVVLFKDQLHIGRTVYVSNAALRQQLTITNYGAEPIQANVVLGFDSDFADLFEVRGMHRPHRGKIVRSVVSGTSALLSYTGLDGAVRETHVEFEPAPAALSATAARYNLSLTPNAHAHITLDVTSSSGEPRARLPGFISGLNATKREIRNRLRNQATIETGNGEFNAVLRRCAADLAVLTTETADGPYPYAGIPWFSTAFGRDGLITALETLWLNPALARGVLCHLARHQATIEDAASDAQPGKILHEVRGGEMAALGEIPFGRYYGSVDSTPLFVVLAGHYARQTGDYALIADLWPNISAALAWMDGPGDPDGDGFIEYARSDQGLVNQGWKDFGRFHLSRQRYAGGGPDRARRGSGVCLRGEVACRRDGAAPRQASDSAGPDPARRRAQGEFRPRLLVGPARVLRARARRQEATVRGPIEQCRPGASQRHCVRGTRASGGRRDARSLALLGVGRADRCRERAALQPDVLSQRLDLAP